MASIALPSHWLSGSTESLSDTILTQELDFQSGFGISEWKTAPIAILPEGDFDGAANINLRYMMGTSLLVLPLMEINAEENPELVFD